jgi:hypothetical protein
MRGRARIAGGQRRQSERLVIQRIGQDIFRAALMDYWGACCPITGITEPALLRASHASPRAGCPLEPRRGRGSNRPCPSRMSLRRPMSIRMVPGTVLSAGPQRLQAAKAGLMFGNASVSVGSIRVSTKI